MTMQKTVRRVVGSVTAALLVGGLAIATPAPASAAEMVPLTVTILRVTGTSPDADWSAGDYYVKVKIGDNPSHENINQQIERFDFAPPWKFTDLVDPGKGLNVPVTIQLWDDDYGYNDQIDINPADDVLTVEVTFNLATGTWSGSHPDFAIGLAKGDGDQEEYVELYDGWPGTLLFDIAPGSGDADGDGIADGVERFGIRDTNGQLVTDMAAMGADPCRKTLAVETDWLETPGHSHKPSPTAVSEIRTAYANAPVPAAASCPYPGFPKAASGINLILDVNSAIPVTEAEDLEAFNLDQLGAAKKANFNAARDPYFHYNVFAHTLKGGTNNTSGRCCWDGTDFIVTLGNWAGPTNNGTDRDQSGSFMHEFGHALGLGHGGIDTINHKPNYLSVMSYRFQTIGIPNADIVASSEWSKANKPNLVLAASLPDYSRKALPDLDETKLDETKGIGDGNALTAWSDSTDTTRSGRGDGSLDWDWDSPGGAGPFEPLVAADVNRNKEEACVSSKGDAFDTTPADDDVVISNRVYSGADRTCDTTAAGDDEQTQKVGWTQPKVLKGASDWDQLKYRAPLSPDSAGASPEPHDDITYDEARAIFNQWVAAINTPPVAEAGGPYQVNEGSSVTLDAGGSSDADDDPLSYTWSPGTHLDNPTSKTPKYAGVDDGAEVLTLTVKDPGGFSDSDTATVTVKNVPPSVDGTGASIQEGQSASVSATFTDPGTLDTHTATIDWGDGTTPEKVAVTQGKGSGSLQRSHVYGDNGQYNVTISVTDDDGGVGKDVVTVSVGNQHPELALDTSGAVQFPGGEAMVGELNAAQQYKASATDAGSDDLKFAWTNGGTSTYFNNGISPDPLPSPLGTFPFAAADTEGVGFSKPGAYKVGVTVTDDDGGSDGGEMWMIVVGDATTTYGPGYWKHQYEGKGQPQVDPASLAGYLEIVRLVSGVFSEKTALATAADAATVLSPNGGDKRAVATADLLSAWLQFASGAVPWDATVSLGQNQSAPYLAVMAEIESIVKNAAATPADLLRASSLAQRVMQAG